MYEICTWQQAIGALHQPLRVFNGAHVFYVNCKTVDDLHSGYPELKIEA